MCTDNNIVCPWCVLLDLCNKFTKLMWEIPACGVRDVEGGGTGLDHFTKDLQCSKFILPWDLRKHVISILDLSVMSVTKSKVCLRSNHAELSRAMLLWYSSTQRNNISNHLERPSLQQDIQRCTYLCV